MYLLQSIVDIIKTNGPQSPVRARNAAPIDAETYWQGIFGEMDDEGDRLFRVDPGGQAPMNVDEIVPGVGPGTWANARYLPTPLDDVPGINDPMLSDEERALLRRGATLEMIDELRLTYSGQQGITGNLGEYHFHFGWIMHRSWTRVPADEVELAIQVAMIDTPERFVIENGCVHERVWVPA